MELGKGRVPDTQLCPKQEFSAWALLVSGPDGSLLWGCPVHCRALSRIPGLCPPDAWDILPLAVTTTNECLQTLLNVPWGAKLPPVGNCQAKLLQWIKALYIPGSLHVLAQSLLF